jgi:hypothetical protein
MAMCSRSWSSTSRSQVLFRPIEVAEKGKRLAASSKPRLRPRPCGTWRRAAANHRVGANRRSPAACPGGSNPPHPTFTLTSLPGDATF